eukprot:CAMPEP_0172684050 /NCGR_PEP_ID=MMETSP1074-20121228/19282_1 /TAXON_ID=2916 /ORGANISM="Ceratium fusus, Strain PA161109" /LENGTH=181 /DNA_ID=CAMNT_0013502989 /DNA_START=58 /DNA_END=603 /DNA_ORIENTATION=-
MSMPTNIMNSSLKKLQMLALVHASLAVLFLLACLAYCFFGPDDVWQDKSVYFAVIAILVYATVGTSSLLSKNKLHCINGHMVSYALGGFIFLFLAVLAALFVYAMISLGQALECLPHGCPPNDYKPPGPGENLAMFGLVVSSAMPFLCVAVACCGSAYYANEVRKEHKEEEEEEALLEAGV